MSKRNLYTQEQLYSLPLLYDKLGVKIYRDCDNVIKLFEGENSNVLMNKKQKVEIYSSLDLSCFVECLFHNFENLLFSYYVINIARGKKVVDYKGYKYDIKSKIKVLLKVFDCISEAHQNNILINDIHGRNFFYDNDSDSITGIDIDNFQIEGIYADELPDFMGRFVNDVTGLSIKTDSIAFGLMILDILGPKDIDLDNYPIPELLEYICMLKMPNFVKEEFYNLFERGCANLEKILYGLSEETGKVLCKC